MEEAAELGNYLPLSFKSPKEQEYIEFLWDAFETNYTHGKYQFAFLAYHMLTMSFVYFNIWQIKQTEPGDFAKGLIGFGKDVEKNLLEATSLFVFSTVNERSILRFLKLIACDNAQIGTYAKLVDDRNDTAHPNGNIFFSTQAALDAGQAAQESAAVPAPRAGHATGTSAAAGRSGRRLSAGGDLACSAVPTPSKEEAHDESGGDLSLGDGQHAADGRAGARWLSPGAGSGSPVHAHRPGGRGVPGGG